MKLNKYQSLLGATSLLIIAIFNILFWVIVPSIKDVITPNITIAYVFMMLGLVLATTSLFGFTLKKRDAIILTAPILYITLGYLLAQILVGSIFILLDGTKYLISISVQVVVLLIYIIFILLAFLGLTHISDNQTHTRTKVNYIQGLLTTLDEIMGMNKDELKTQAYKELYEKIKYSDPISHPTLREDELIIEAKIEAIKASILKGEEVSLDLITMVTNLVVLRNKKCLRLKK